MTKKTKFVLNLALQTAIYSAAKAWVWERKALLKENNMLKSEVKMLKGEVALMKSGMRRATPDEAETIGRVLRTTAPSVVRPVPPSVIRSRVPRGPRL